MEAESSKTKQSLYVRNIIFGVEDSLVSTVGLLAGIASTSTPIRTILLTGFIYIVVEGYSMAAGSYLSEHSAQEYETGSEVKSNEPLIGAGIMFASFVVAGIVPIAPYMLLAPHAALIGSVLASLVFLAILGFIQAKISRVSKSRSVIRMVIVGGIAIVLGIVIGKLLGIA